MALWPKKGEESEEKDEAVPQIQLPAELQAEAKSSPSQQATKPVVASAIPVAKAAGNTAGAGGDGADGLQQLNSSLGQVESLLENAQQQVAHYLLAREAEIVTGGGGGAQTTVQSVEGLGEVISKLDLLMEGLETVHTAVQQAPKTAPTAEGAPAAQPGVSEEVLKAAFTPMQQKIDTLEVGLKKMDNLEAGLQAIHQQTAGPNADAAVAPVLTTLGQISEGINMHHTGVIELVNQLQAAFGQLQASVGQVQQHVDGGMQHIVQLLQPPEPETPDEPEPVLSDWERAILGPALAENPALAYQRKQLIDGVMAGEHAAMSLVGQIIVFQAASTEKMAPQLKDIGEALYRWSPKADSSPNPFEQALSDWLQQRCDEVGLGNRIELVNPGERFDTGRHTAADRGVEITQVLGWVVLRDNGRVFTKAAVAVK